MAVPTVIPIAHEPDGRTGTIGHYADGQFLASISYAFADGYRFGAGWEEHKRLYAVLHRFDAEGRHVDADIWRAGTWAEQQRAGGDGSVVARAEARLTTLLDGLPGRGFGDIAIRPFRLTVDEVTFGLITERHADGEGGHDWAEFYPDGLGFSEPWDGTYDT